MHELKRLRDLVRRAQLSAKARRIPRRKRIRKPAYDFVINTMNDHSQVLIFWLRSTVTDDDIAIGSVA
jgi:hypothetical protein